jgi:hypothetical protein
MMHIFLHEFVSELSCPMLDLNSLGRYRLPYHIKLTFLFRTRLLQVKNHRLTEALFWLCIHCTGLGGQR